MASIHHQQTQTTKAHKVFGTFIRKDMDKNDEFDQKVVEEIRSRGNRIGQAYRVFTFQRKRKVIVF